MNEQAQSMPEAPAATPPRLPTKAELVRSRHRKFFGSLFASLLVGAACAAAAWHFAAPRYKAEVAIYVSREVGSPLDVVRHSVSKDEYDTFKNTQAAMLRHKNTIEKALRQIDPATGREISALGEVTKRRDPVEWLSNSLEINFPRESELMFVGLKGKNSDELAKIVNAVCDAYIKQVKENVRGQQSQGLAELRAKYEQTTNEIQSTENKLNELAAAQGFLEREALQASVNVKLARLTQLNSQIVAWESRKAEQEIQVVIANVELEHTRNQHPTAAELEAELLKDKAYEEKIKRRDMMKEALAQLVAKVPNPDDLGSVKRLRSDLESLEQSIDAYRAEKRPLIRDRLAAPTEVAKLTAEIAAYRQGIEQLDSLTKNAKAEAEKLQAQINAMGQRQPEVEGLQDKLALLKEDARTMKSAILKLEILQAQPDRIRRYGDVTQAGSVGQVFHYLATIAAGLAGFALSMFLLGCWFLLRYWLNNPPFPRGGQTQAQPWPPTTA